MKKIFLYLFMCVTALNFMASCGDNEDVSVPHILTDDEIAEIHRQDSIDSINKTKINAGLILEYTAEITVTPLGYDGAYVVLDTVKIAEYFGITCEGLRKGIMNMRPDAFGGAQEGGAKITGFGINWTSRQDDMTAFNTNACWGHWWNGEGDICSWGDEARVFAEYDPEGGYFHVGQMEGKLGDCVGKEIKFIEGLKYQDYRVAIVITAVPKNPEAMKVEVIEEIDVPVEQFIYDGTLLVPFDQAYIMEKLGVSSWTDASFVGINPDGSIEQFSTASSGYWYDANGQIITWGEGCTFCVEYWGFEYGQEYPDDLNNLYIAQFGDFMETGTKITGKFAFVNSDGKAVVLNINYEIVDYPDPDTAPAGDPTTDSSIDITIEKEWTDTYNNIKSDDISAALADAFKMTKAEIFVAMKKGDLKIYVDEVGTDAPAYTSDVPGYWLSADGKVANWGDGSAVFVCLSGDRNSLYFYAGNFPDTELCPAETEVKTVYKVCCNGGVVTANITVKVNAPAAQ